MLTILNKRILEHRMVWQKNNGKIPFGKEIHHINGNRLDNRIENLRLMTKSSHALYHWQKRNELKGGKE